MNRISLLLLAALALHAADPARQIMSGSAELSGGIFIRYSTVVVPPLKNSQIMMLGGGIATERDRVHRTMSDKTNQTYVGYDLIVEPAGPKSFRVSIEPLTRPPQDGRQLMLPKYPPPQVVEEGDTIELELLTSADGSQKLVDYIEVMHKIEPRGSASNTPARDFTLDDGPLDLKFAQPARMWVNGQQWQNRVGWTVKPGGTIWFAVPNKGRYILSFTARDGFVKAGAIRDNVLQFEAAGERYEYRTSGPILGAGAAWNLYVSHDPSYQPKFTPEPTIFGGTDRLDNLLKERQ